MALQQRLLAYGSQRFGAHLPHDHVFMNRTFMDQLNIIHLKSEFQVDFVKF